MVAISFAAGLVVLVGIAWALWTSGGTGSAAAETTTLAPPAMPDVSALLDDVDLSWSAPTPPGAGTVDYHVERRRLPGSSWSDACGTTTSSRITATGCTDQPGDGQYVWRVTANFHTWTATSSESDPATVDVNPPTGIVTSPTADANVRAGVTITSDSADTGSGVASATFEYSPAGADTWTTIDTFDTSAPYSAAWDTTAIGDGLYDLRVRTLDNVGHTFLSPPTVDVRVDNTAPGISLALAPNPTGASMTGTVTYFRASASGSLAYVATVTDSGSGPASAVFPVRSTAGWSHPAETVTSPSGGPYQSSAFTWSSGASAPANYTITVADAAGNTASIATTSTIDTTNPTGSVTAPVAAANIRGTVNVTSNSADAGSGVASAQFQTSPAGAATWTNLGSADLVAPFATTWDTTTFTEGLYDLRSITTDRVGNTFTSPTIANVRADNTPPTGSITAPASSSLVKGTYIVTSNSADTGSGVASALFQRSPAGANTWTNVATADTTSPYTASWATTDGLYDLRLTTTDRSGNTFVSSLITNVRADNTNPTGSITSPVAAANVRGSVAVTSNSADAGSGVATVQFQTSPAGTATWSDLGSADLESPYATTWDTTIFTEGLYDLRVITTDNNANVRTSATIANVRVDNTAPTGSVTAPASSANIKGTFVVTSNSADTGSGVASALFQRSPAGQDTWTNVTAADTTSPYTASWITTGVPAGLYDLQVITTDKAGNTSTSPLATDILVDNTVPVVTVALADAPSGAFLSAAKIYFKANAAGSFGLVATVTDGGSGPVSATFPVLNATNWTTHTAETVTTPSGGPYESSTYSWSSGATAPATHTITGTDAAGNNGTRAITFTIDSTNPTGSVTAPAAAANVRGTVNVTSSSADAGSGVASAQFQTSPVGSGIWSDLGDPDTVTPFATSWDTTEFSEGLYNLRVITTDNVGNVFTSATIANVRVDNTDPTGALTAPTSNAFIAGASVAVSANSADAGSVVLNAQFQTSPASAGTWSNLGAADTTSPYGVTWNTTTFGDGRYDVRVVTTDKAGNTFTSGTTTVEIQNSAPTATGVQLTNGASTAGMAESGDEVAITYSQTMSVSSMCSIWSGNLTDQSLANATVTVTDGGGSNDTLSYSSGSCTLYIGTIDLGSTAYTTGGSLTFSSSAIAWSATTRVLTITLGSAGGAGTTGTVASSSATYTPAVAIKNAFGTAITGTFITGSLTQL